MEFESLLMQSNYPFNPNYIDTVKDYAFIERFLLPEQCDDIVDVGTKLKKFKGDVISDGNLQNDYRDCSLAYIGHNDLPWLFDELAYAIQEINKHHFNFDIWGLAEGLQFTEYNEPGHQYKIHSDKIFGFNTRKLSCVLQLTDEEEYEGCDLELIYNEPYTKVPRTRGSLVVFPSYVTHRVTPLISGTRHSLVAWVNGKPFT